MNRLPTLLALTLLTGCGASSTPCVYGTSYGLSQTATTADHAAASPGNQVQFRVSASQSVISGTSCPISALVALVYATWTNPDPTDITISSASDSTNGLATCNSATTGPVTLSTTVGSGTSARTLSGQLTCK